MDRAWTGREPESTRGGSAAGGAAVYNLQLPPKASGEDTGAGPAPGFMRLTPDSRAPAKADPSARAGVVVVVVVAVAVAVVVVDVVVVVVVVVVLVFCCCCCSCCSCRGRRCFFLLLFLLLLWLLADIGPIWAQVCPCLGPRWLLLLLADVGPIWVIVVAVVGRCWPYWGAGLPLSWP